MRCCRLDSGPVLNSAIYSECPRLEVRYWFFGAPNRVGMLTHTSIWGFLITGVNHPSGSDRTGYKTSGLAMPPEGGRYTGIHIAEGSVDFI